MVFLAIQSLAIAQPTKSNQESSTWAQAVSVSNEPTTRRTMPPSKWEMKVPELQSSRRGYEVEGKGGPVPSIIPYRRPILMPSVPTVVQKEWEFTVEHSKRNSSSVGGEWEVVKKSRGNLATSDLGYGSVNVVESRSHIKKWVNVCERELSEQEQMKLPSGMSVPLLQDVEGKSFELQNGQEGCKTIITQDLVRYGFFINVRDVSQKMGVEVQFEIKELLGIKVVNQGEAFMQIPNTMALAGKVSVNLESNSKPAVQIAEATEGEDRIALWMRRTK
jgi:hypothetical protein